MKHFVLYTIPRKFCWFFTKPNNNYTYNKWIDPNNEFWYQYRKMIRKYIFRMTDKEMTEYVIKKIHEDAKKALKNKKPRKKRKLPWRKQKEL